MRGSYLGILAIAGASALSGWHHLCRAPIATEADVTIAMRHLPDTSMTLGGRRAGHLGPYVFEIASDPGNCDDAQPTAYLYVADTLGPDPAHSHRAEVLVRPGDVDSFDSLRIAIVAIRILGRYGGI